jgi:Domain of unknown function (DUF4136)
MRRNERERHAMMKTIPRWWALPCLAATLAACSSVEMYAAKSPTASFAEYKTYAYATSETTPAGFAVTPLAPPIQAKVQVDIDREMASKGYALATAGAKPDLLVRPGSGSRNLEDVAWVDFDQIVEYTQATFMIDVFDAHTLQPVWHGSSRHVLEEAPGSGSGVSDASLADAVRSVLRTLPHARGATPQ